MSTKRKPQLPPKLGQPMVKQSAKVVGKGGLDESKTIVSGGGNAIKPMTNGGIVVEISSDSSSAEEDSEDNEESADEQDEAQPEEEDVAMDVATSTREEPIEEDNGGEPSFGDLVKANAPEPIDVAGAFDDPSSRALAYPQGAQIQTPSGASLGTVLTQALKTNDVSLLESCLHTTEVNTIRATIQRLDSPLAGTLLQKLAERLHRRPGRAGSLMVWVQWTLVTHGGYLATQRDLIKKLAELNKVIDERARGLQSLLSVKGKLDMLEAQIELRRSMQNQRRRLDEEDDDEDVIYVEGQDSDEEAAKPQQNGNVEVNSDEQSDVSDDMPMTNGVIADSEGDDSEEDDLLDDEAEETDEDDGDEDEVDHDDQDAQGEDEESDDGIQAAPPAKIQKTSGLSSRRR